MKKQSDYGGGGLVIVKMVGATAAPSRGRRRRLRRLRLLLLPPGKTLRLASNHTIIIHRHCCSGVGSLIGKKLHSQVSTMENLDVFPFIKQGERCSQRDLENMLSRKLTH